MNVICNDNRFEIVEKFKKRLIKETNIKSCPDEMAVIDDILFRFWQLGWLDKIDANEPIRCKDCKYAEWRDNFDPPIAQYFCEFMDANVELKGDDFCSRAERKEETEC